ncbi:MAG: GntR family transcriptional regulator [Microbacteriaceae bacterium]
MATVYVPVRRKAYGEQVTEYLRDAIVQGELPVGMRLVEEHLAHQFGVSRGPIRDALRRLERESLIESRGTGNYVVGIAEADIDELYSLRQAVESLAAELAMDRTTPDGWAEMTSLVRDLEAAAETQDHTGFAAADIQFHSRIYTLSGHRRLADVWQQYAPILTTLLRTAVLKDADLHESAAKHRLLLELMTAGDKPAVAAELKDHLEGSHQRMLASHRNSQTGESA